jgi:hypothetical protein
MIPDDARDQIHGWFSEWSKDALKEHSTECWKLLNATFVKRAGLLSALLTVLLVGSDGIAFKYGADMKGDVATCLEKLSAQEQDAINTKAELSRQRTLLDTVIAHDRERDKNAMEQLESTRKILRILERR